MKRNWEGLVLKAFGGKDFRLTVIDSTAVTSSYQRLLLEDGGLLKNVVIHPTMWIRLWFDHRGKAHQRAYTLVDPDPAAGRFSLEFALHDGPAANWAVAAGPGDTVDATVQGSAFAMPADVTRMHVIGDPASLPAVNSLLDSHPSVAATVWLDAGCRQLPLRSRDGDTVTFSEALVDDVCAALPNEPDALYWVATESARTRAVARHLRRTVDKRLIRSLGYWTL